MRRPDGVVHDFFLHGNFDVAVMMGLTLGKQAVLINQYFISQKRTHLSAVGGFIEPGERPGRAAAREFLEETGYRAKKIINLGQTFRGKYMTGRVHHFLALGAELVQAPQLEPAELGTTVIEMPIVKIKNLLQKNVLEDMYTEICLRRALDYLKEHKL